MRTCGDNDTWPRIIATTQPTTQNKTKEFGWSGIIIGKKPTPHQTTPHHTTTTM
jgi:hypothetical protein